MVTVNGIPLEKFPDDHFDEGDRAEALRRYRQRRKDKAESFTGQCGGAMRVHNPRGFKHVQMWGGHKIT